MPGNNTFINANDLSAEELAKLLKQIGSNQKLYDAYFQFKDKPLSPSFKAIGEMSYTHPNVLKRICDYALNRKNS